MKFHSVTPTLFTTDIARTVTFYTTNLGFTVDTLWPEHEPTMCILDNGPITLIFDTQADWDIDGRTPMFTGQLSFEVEDVDSFYSAIHQKVDVIWGPENYQYGRREFSVKDPNGYRLVFSQQLT